MLKCTFRDSTHIIKEIKFQFNNSVHCLGTRENVLRIWDIFTKKCIHTLEGHTDEIVFNNGAKGGFCGYRLVAAREFKVNETVAHMNLVTEPPGDNSWTDDQVFVSKSKIWSCGPPTSDRLGVLMNASCFTSEKNCKFSRVNQNKKVMCIKAAKTIRKNTELLAGQYMRGLGVPNVPLLKPGVGSFRQKIGKQTRAPNGRFAKK